MENKKVGSSGLGLTSVVQIVFIVLKLLKLIDWSWWWVLSPFWISALIVILIIWVIVLYKLFTILK